MSRTTHDLSDFIAFTPIAVFSSIFSATLSSFSSMFVMTFILRSQSKLRSAYHRIMFFMSFWDLISSLAIAATTLPMPSDVQEVYPFAGVSIGNISTCEAQAFMIVVGSIFTICSNCALNLFYVCTIRFGMSEAKFNKVVMPACLVLCIASLPYPIHLLSSDLYNPTVSYPYCLVSLYPYNCDENGDVGCIRGGGHTVINIELQKFMFVFLVTGFVTISGSLTVVIFTVFKTEMEARNEAQAARAHNNNMNMNRSNVDRDRRRDGNNSSNNDGAPPPTASHLPLPSHTPTRSAEFEETRATLRQALMYIGAFLLTWVWTGIFLVAGGFSTKEFLIWPVIDQLKLFFQPLQGFFNGVIFAYSKARILQRASRSMSLCRALERVVTSPNLVPEVMISRLEMVHHNQSDEATAGRPAARDIIPNEIPTRRMAEQSTVSNLESIDPSAALSENVLSEESSSTRRVSASVDRSGGLLSVGSNSHWSDSLLNRLRRGNDSFIEDDLVSVSSEDNQSNNRS